MCFQRGFLHIYNFNFCISSVNLKYLIISSSDWYGCLSSPRCSEIPPLERQARGRRLQQQTHQTGWQSHHPGNLMSASCAQSPRGDIRVCSVFLDSKAFQVNHIQMISLLLGTDINDSINCQYRDILLLKCHLDP